MRQITKRIGMTYAQIVSKATQEAYALIKEHSQKFEDEFFNIVIEYYGYQWQIEKHRYHQTIMGCQEEANRIIRFKDSIIFLGTHWDEDDIYIVVDGTLYELAQLYRRYTE